MERGTASSWSDSEIQGLLSVWAEDQIQAELDSSFHNEKAYQIISDRLHGIGIQKTFKQCRDKIKNLKVQYRKIKDHNSRAGADGNVTRWRWYDVFDAVLCHTSGDCGRSEWRDSAVPSLEGMITEQDLHLPLSSLRLFVSPLCLMSASMWQVAQQRNVQQYGKLEEFVTLVTELVPELLTFSQRAQLILGLRARLVLELCQSKDSLDLQTIQQHLDRIHQSTETFKNKEEEEVKASKSHFVELVQTLLQDPTVRDHFFKEVFPVHYGPRYDRALQILVWEFFSRLEELLAAPSFAQVASCLSFIESDLEDCEESFSDPEPLTTLLQHQRSKGQLDKGQFSLNSDIILATLSLVQDEYTFSELKKGMRDSTTPERENVNEGTEKCEQNVDNWADVKEEMEEDPCSSVDNGDDHRILPEAGESHSEQRLQDSSPQTSSLSPAVANSSQSGDAASHGLPSSSSYLTNKILQHRIQTQHAAKGSQFESSDCRPSSSTLTSWGSPTSSSAKRTKTLTCTPCRKTFSCLADMERHHRRVHAELERVSCNQCGKIFKGIDGLRMHEQTHMIKKPHICSHCGRGFKTSAVLKTHEYTHTGERPFACSLCDKTFKQKTILRTHLRTHTGDRPYLCCACGKTFCTSGALLVHSRLHTGERPYHCNYCGKDYMTSQRLRVHQRYHTGERPYPCKHCEKSFPTPFDLKRHIHTHTGEKPHPCLKCGKRFSQIGSMRTHLRSHKS